jgi:hypothetical protein
MTVGLLLVVTGMFFTGVTTMQNGVVRASDRSESNDNVRLAVEQIDREVRSGNLFHDPALETTATCAPGAGMCLRIYTQTNAEAHDPGNRCVQWRVLAGKLETRDWSPDYLNDHIVGSWRTVASNVVNTTATPPFRLDSAASTAGRLLHISIIVNKKSSSGGDVRVDMSVAGRNTQFGYPAFLCDTPPAG